MLYLRASAYLRVVTHRGSREFYPSGLSLDSFQARFSSGKHRVMSTLGTTGAAEAPPLTCTRMASDGTGRTNPEGLVGNILEPEVRKRLIEIMSSSGSNQWENSWKEGVTPWDVGGVTPIIQHIVDKGEVPDGRTLVPGCGSGYDVLALASEKRQVIGLDISETANSRAKKHAAADPRGKWVEFLVDDFFTYKPEAPFNFIFDYTFFCALNPALRPVWAAKIAELLSPDGDLLTLMFPLGQYEGGPPFAVTVDAYEEVLNPVGFRMVSCEDSEFTVPMRKGKEKVARWKKTYSSI